MSVKKTINSNISVGIVGAGPAGALSAYLLARQGYNVTLIERQSEVKRKVCGEYLCPKAVELLFGLGLLEETCQGFEQLFGMVIVSPKQVVVETDFPENNFGLSLNRQVFDQRLIALALSSGAKLYSNWILNSANQTSSGKWEIRSSLGESLSFDLLIAADGRQSKIGHYLGHIRELNTTRAALHCYLPRKKYFGERRGEMHIFANGSYCGIDPITDLEVNFSVVINSEDLKTNKPEDLIEHYINLSSRLKCQFDTSKLSSVEIKKVTCLKNHNEFIAGSNLAYVGDADVLIDPLTGEGIYNALLSAHLLVESILAEKTMTKALNRYKKHKRKIRREKDLVNHFFQKLIKHAYLLNIIARFLKKRKQRGDAFIAIVGNIYNPLEGLIRLIKA